MCCPVRFCFRVSVQWFVFYVGVNVVYVLFFFFQAEDGIRDLVRSRGLGDVYKRQSSGCAPTAITSS